MDTAGKSVKDDTRVKCSEKDPDHIEEYCLKETRCANYRQNHPAYAKFCEAYEREILAVKQRGSKENSREVHG